MKSMEKSRIALRELLNQYTPHADRLAQVEEELNSNVGNPTKISILLQERKLLLEYVNICIDKKADITKYCSNRAADIIWDSYALRKKTESVADKYGISKRSLELWLEFWIDKHYLIKKPVEDGETPWSPNQMNS